MTPSTHSETGFPHATAFFDDQCHDKSGGLFVVTVWSVAGMALATLFIWLGLGGQIDSLIGLG